MMQKVDYSQDNVPKEYKCSDCGKTNCKLWRQYCTFLNHIQLLCVTCAAKSQNKDIQVDSKGFHQGEYGASDQIGWCVPAVPTEEGDAYWGYTSVPENGVIWWRNLPT